MSSYHKFKIIGILVLVIALSAFLSGCNTGAGESYTNGDINISQFELDVTDNSGELEFDIVAHSDQGIMSIEVESSEEEKNREFGNESTAEFSGIIDAYPGTDEKLNNEEINVYILTEEGSKESASKEHYVRKYDVFEGNNSVEVGVTYWQYLGVEDQRGYKQWEEDSVGIPLMGEYYYKDNLKDIVNRHIDQMQSRGISRLTLSYLASGLHHDGNEERFDEFKEADLFNEIDLEVQYDFNNFFGYVKDNRPEVIKNDLEFIRENIFTMDNYNTYNDRPIIIFWTAYIIEHFYNEDDDINEKWDDLEDFMEFMRSTLTINGVEPFIIGDFQHLGYRYKHGRADEKMIDFLDCFDAATTWQGIDLQDEVIPWSEQYEFVSDNFAGFEQLHNNYDIEFVPRAFPGFDTKNNLHRIDNDRLTPPNPEYFGKMLELVDQYRTLPLINIATWNEWEEALNIEPGYYHERSIEDYPAYDQRKFGFDYLDEIKEFLQ